MECPDDGSMNAADQPIGTVAARNNTLPMNGFCCMLAGPAILFLAVMVHWIGFFTPTTASIVSSVALLLPAVGAVISWVSLARWKHIGTPGRAYAIVTVVMCNPYFYMMYLGLCTMANKSLAELPTM